LLVGPAQADLRNIAAPAGRCCTGDGRDSTAATGLGHNSRMSRAIAHIDSDALARSLADLDRPDGDGVDVQRGIERVILGAAGVFAGSGVGLMLIADDGLTLRYVASSDEVARRLEIAHERAGEGPCVDAFVRDATVETGDLETEQRWPDLRAELRNEPIRAVLGLPTRLGTPVGTLNLYCERPRAWDASEIAALEAYNSLLEARLGGALIARAHGEIVDQLQFALDSRVAIERAIGLLMGRDGLGNLEAFEVLRSNARSSRRRVLTVAEEMLASHPVEAIEGGDGTQALPDGYSSSG
jgi:GAF domain-containing protein